MLGAFFEASGVYQSDEREEEGVGSRCSLRPAHRLDEPHQGIPR